MNKEFVINAVTDDLAQKMNITSTPYPRYTSEFEKAGLTPAKADLVKAPLVAESPINMECSLVQILEFGKPPIISRFIIGEVFLVHIRDDFYDNQQKRVSGLRTIARLGGNGDLYCLSQDIFEMKRPF